MTRRELALISRVVAAALVLSACASLPPCPRFNVSIYPTQKGPLFVIDEANMLIMAGRMQQLRDRSCDPDAPEVEAAPAPAPKPAADPAPAGDEPWRHELRPA